MRSEDEEVGGERGGRKGGGRGGGGREEGEGTAAVVGGLLSGEAMMKV